MQYEEKAPRHRLEKQSACVSGKSLFVVKFFMAAEYGKTLLASANSLICATELRRYPNVCNLEYVIKCTETG